MMCTVSSKFYSTVSTLSRSYLKGLIPEIENYSGEEKNKNNKNDL